MIDLEKEKEAYAKYNHGYAMSPDECAEEAGWIARAELAQDEISELKQKLARYENPDYVLVPRNSNNHIEDIMNEIIWDKGGFQIHRESNKIVYEAIIEAVEKGHE